VASYAFNGKAFSHIGLVMARDRAAGPAAPNAPKGGDFLLLELASGKSQNIRNVVNFCFNKAGTWLAYNIYATNQAGNSLDGFF
jgi:hypothetical protein